MEKVYFIAFIHSGEAYAAEGSASYGRERCAPGTPAPAGAFRRPAHRSGLNDSRSCALVFPSTNLTTDAFSAESICLSAEMSW